jgi:hypothetical protein
VMQMTLKLIASVVALYGSTLSTSHVSLTKLYIKIKHGYLGFHYVFS